MGFGAAAIETARGEKRQAVRRRWESGIMGWGWRGLSSGPGAAVLESQAAQRDGRGEPQRAGSSQAASCCYDVMATASRRR